MQRSERVPGPVVTITPWLLAGMLAGTLSTSCWALAAKDVDASDTPSTSARAQGEKKASDSGDARVDLDPDAIAAIIGVHAQTTADGAVRVTWSRTDVPVTVDGMSFPAAAGLTSWAGFAPTAGGAVLMGDTVVFQDEVDAAMDAAFAHDLEVTALHNHFFHDEPRVFFMHVGGHGHVDDLARGVSAMWDAIRKVRQQSPAPPREPAAEASAAGDRIDARSIGTILGLEPTVTDGVVKVTIARTATMHGTSVSGSMGLTTWAAFSGTAERATVDGDFAMTDVEVQTVLRALRRAGIHIVALHNHMIGEVPPLYFTHFWARGPASDLARGLRSALDSQRAVARADR